MLWTRVAVFSAARPNRLGYLNALKVITVTFARSLQSKANDTDEHNNVKFSLHIFFVVINFDPIKIHSGEMGILAAAYSHSGEKGAAKWARRNESGEMGSGEKGAAERARRNESGETSINPKKHRCF